MSALLIIICSIVTIAAFLFMEGVAWFSHKYIMHGILWSWHKSHHTVHNHAFERNDLFAVVFSVPSILLIYYSTVYTYNPFITSIGIGIFCYGAFYVAFHDIVVHQRIKWRPYKRSSYLNRMINAHYIHHSKHTKENCEAFGFLYAPPKYENKKLALKQERQQTQ
ncbi:MAG: sterol desaturase family protein [Flammeovirgaceae bacterium]|nr:sterol desaturase family protein [Flammeovirgaceae bacterium]